METVSLSDMILVSFENLLNILRRGFWRVSCVSTSDSVSEIFGRFKPEISPPRRFEPADTILAARIECPD